MDLRKNDSPIGGFLPLGPLGIEKHLYGGVKYNSARSAIVDVVIRAGVDELWVPYYFCDTVAKHPGLENVRVCFYELNEDFSISEPLEIKSNALLLFVNFFGLCDELIPDVIRVFGDDKLIIDNTQAFFSPPQRTRATVYSPRKFFGLPDGGLLYSTGYEVEHPRLRDMSSKRRLKHLMPESENARESMYEAFTQAENELAGLPIEGMSLLTEDLFSRCDIEFARAKRQENAAFLHSMLRRKNRIPLRFGHSPAPLCYPFLPANKVPVRSDLSPKHVFLPAYYPEVLDRVDVGSFEWELASHCLFLPCDQRYSLEEMADLVQLIESFGA